MPTDIQRLTEIDFKLAFTYAIIIMAGIVALKELVTKFCTAIGLEMPWLRKEREQRERIDNLQKTQIQTEEQIKSLVNTVDNIQDMVTELSSSVNTMREKSNANEAARLKDRISQSYRYFHEKGEWTAMEKESFKDLIAAYTQYSENSFVHSVCEVECESWRVVDHT